MSHTVLEDTPYSSPRPQNFTNIIYTKLTIEIKHVRQYRKQQKNHIKFLMLGTADTIQARVGRTDRRPSSKPLPSANNAAYATPASAMVTPLNFRQTTRLPTRPTPPSYSSEPNFLGKWVGFRLIIGRYLSGRLYMDTMSVSRQDLLLPIHLSDKAQCSWPSLRCR